MSDYKFNADKVKQQLANQMPVGEIAEIAGVSKGYMYRLIKAHGLEYSLKRKSEMPSKKVLALHCKSAPKKQIALLLNVSVYCLDKWLDHYDLKVTFGQRKRKKLSCSPAAIAKYEKDRFR